jgi:gas vesicle protein
MSDQKNNNLNAFVTGAVLGAIATFLFATKSGRKIKDELIEEGIRIFEAVTEEIEEAPEQIKEGEKEIKKELAQKAQQIAEVKEAVVDTAGEVLREVPEQIENIQKKGRHFFFSKKSHPKNES